MIRKHAHTITQPVCTVYVYMYMSLDHTINVFKYDSCCLKLIKHSFINIGVGDDGIG